MESPYYDSDDNELFTTQSFNVTSTHLDYTRTRATVDIFVGQLSFMKDTFILHKQYRVMNFQQLINFKTFFFGV